MGKPIGPRYRSYWDNRRRWQAFIEWTRLQRDPFSPALKRRLPLSNTCPSCGLVDENLPSHCRRCRAPFGPRAQRPIARTTRPAEAFKSKT